MGIILRLRTKYQIWHFSNALRRESPPLSTGYDKMYIPQVGYTIADCNAHDLVFDKTHKLVFVNTLFSCVAAISDTDSFIPLWKPSFISSLAPENRCYLNGLAYRDDKPRYVTAFAATDEKEGWRQHGKMSGLVIDIQTNEVVCTNLSMPHSPRWYREKLWLLNSGEGEFGYVDIENKRFIAIAFCPGYARGLSFCEDFALIGLSKFRHSESSQGLGLEHKLISQNLTKCAALQLVNLNTGQGGIVLLMDEAIQEIGDVTFIADTRTPMLLGFRNEEIQKKVVFDEDLVKCVLARDELSKEKEKEEENDPAQNKEKIEDKVKKNFVFDEAMPQNSILEPKSKPLSFSASVGLFNWMNQQKLSFVLNIQSGIKTSKLVLIGSSAEGDPSIGAHSFECGFEAHSAIAVSKCSRKLYIYTPGNMRYFKNTLADKQPYQGYDACFVPHQYPYIEKMDIQDLRIDGEYLFASLPSSCITFIGGTKRNFFTDWSIDELREYDGFKLLQLTGLAFRRGELRYATAIGEIERLGKKTIGVVIDKKVNSIIVANLSRPHSPQWHKGKLWLLDAERQELGYVDINSQIVQYKPVYTHSGCNTRGLAFCGNTAILGVTEHKADSLYTCKILFIDTTFEKGKLRFLLEVSGENILLKNIGLLHGIKRPYLVNTAINNGHEDFIIESLYKKELDEEELADYFLEQQIEEHFYEKIAPLSDSEERIDEKEFENFLFRSKTTRFSFFSAKAENSMSSNPSFWQQYKSILLSLSIAMNIIVLTLLLQEKLEKENSVLSSAGFILGGVRR